ncbi:MAG TPA: glycerol-3-phosphate acyltransferase, partial [Bacteroidales bacterium]|nr:glycerol-3-phosphate acyltransferase [Bacteroidales bacterium]
MVIFLLILAFFAAYLLGSIPTSVWIGKWFRGIDVRDYGSGNAGATNTMRVLGVALGIPVVIIDIAKGFIAVQLSFIYPGFLNLFPDIVVLQLVLGAFAVLGHIYPVFAGFRGGKGVATLFGVILAVQ